MAKKKEVLEADLKYVQQTLRDHEKRIGRLEAEVQSTKTIMNQRGIKYIS
jgi:uncharacterized protein YeeX (DUF496 family)